MFERYSETARRTIAFARHEAAQLGSAEIRPEHILLALLRDEATMSSNLKVDVSIAEIRAELLAYLSPQVSQSVSSGLPFSRESQQLLANAAEEADRPELFYLNNHHILLALARLENSFAAQVLRRNGLSTDNLRHKIAQLRETRTQEMGRILSSATAQGAGRERQLYEFESRILERFRSDDYEGALKLVDDAIADPALDRDQAVRMLTPIASNVARVMRNLELAKYYSELRLSRDPDNAMGLFTLAECLFLQGKSEEALEIAHKAHKISLADVKQRSVAELIEHRFPKIKSEI